MKGGISSRKTKWSQLGKAFSLSVRKGGWNVPLGYADTTPSPPAWEGTLAHCYYMPSLEQDNEILFRFLQILRSLRKRELILTTRLQRHEAFIVLDLKRGKLRPGEQTLFTRWQRIQAVEAGSEPRVPKAFPFLSAPQNAPSHTAPFWSITFPQPKA